MKIIKNEKLIKRNSIIGQWTSILALIVLGGGMYMSFSNPANSQLVTYSIVALVVGFILTQVGMYMGNRYGRSPRPDEKLDAGLKGLPNEFTIYHYTTPVSHLLVGPAGMWVIKPYHQRGQVSFKKNRWQMKGGGFLQSYMRLFGQESIGRPDLETASEINSLKKYLAKQMDESEIPEIKPLIVFTSDEIEIDAEAAPIPTLKAKQLKDFMRQRAKGKAISTETLNNIKTLLSSE